MSYGHKSWNFHIFKTKIKLKESFYGDIRDRIRFIFWAVKIISTDFIIFDSI